MDRGLLAAVRRFPLKSQEIRRLALADGAFRSICEDLADAELACARWGEATKSPRQDQFRSEYEVLANELASEIEGLLAVRARGVAGEHESAKR